MSHLTRRGLLLGGLGIAGATTLAACSTSGAPMSTQAAGSSFGPPTPLASTPGQRVTTARLVAQETTLDLGGPIVATWAYGDTAPGPMIRAGTWMAHCHNVYHAEAGMMISLTYRT